MEKYENKCGSCYWLRDMNDDNTMFCGTSNEKGHCIYLKNCYYPDDTICSHYQNKNSYVPGGGCYITTIVCDMLGFDDKCNILETLRKFRKNVMQTSSEYKEILYEYDTVGPKISKSLKEDNDLELVNGILDFYILPTVDLIKKHNYKEAVLRYKNMTSSLENYYGIEYNGEVPTNYDYKNGGHGYQKIKMGGFKYE